MAILVKLMLAIRILPADPPYGLAKGLYPVLAAISTSCFSLLRLTSGSRRLVAPMHAVGSIAVCWMISSWLCSRGPVQVDRKRPLSECTFARPSV